MVDAGPVRSLSITHVRNIPTATLVGLSAIAFSALFLLSDVIEAIQGAFSDGQPWLTLGAEPAIPIVPDRQQLDDGAQPPLRTARDRRAAGRA